MTTNLDNDVRDLTTEELHLVCGGLPEAHVAVNLGNMTIVGHAYADGSAQGIATTNGGQDFWIHGGLPA
jgi:hypothetical protein